MREAVVVINLYGCEIYQHCPAHQTATKSPDDKTLWNFILEHKDEISGIAHSHPGSGPTSPSREDVTSFAAIESGIGKRLYWPIITSDSISTFIWQGPGEYDYSLLQTGGGDGLGRHHDNNDWVDTLRNLSGYGPPICSCGQSIPLTHGDHHSHDCVMYANHDGIEDHVNVENATSKTIAKWLRSSMASARYGSESWSLRRMLADAIERGSWKIEEPNEGPH